MHCISERREHTAVANTHVEDLCVGGVAALLNDMAKLTLSDADLMFLRRSSGNGLWRTFAG